MSIDHIQNNTHFLSTTQDQWITEYREGNPIWIATLNSGLTVYRDDGRWEKADWSAWYRLFTYCKSTNDYIVSLRYGFRSNMFNLVDGQPGYFFSLGCRGYPSNNKTKQLWRLGIYDGCSNVRITKFFVPEFILTDDPIENRNVSDCKDYSLIKKPYGTT